MGAYQLRLEMIDFPTVWRQLLVPKRISFEELHLVIQYVMGWLDYHLYEFSAKDEPTCYTNDREGIGEYEFYVQNPDLVQDEWAKWILERPQMPAWAGEIDAVLKRSKELEYVYDYGDEWRLKIILEKEVKDYKESFAICLAGGEPAPPEDVGGSIGYWEFLAAWHNPAHSESASMIEWGKSQGYTGRFDLEAVNAFLKWKLPLGRDSLSKLLLELNRGLSHFEVEVAFNSDLTDEQLSSVHFLHFYREFLLVIQGRGPLKATAKGNLPAKLVQELHAQGYDYLYPRFSNENVRKEADALFLSDLHDLAKMTGMVKRRKGYISLTKKGERFLKLPLVEAYYTLLREYLFTFNLGFQREYEPLPIFLYPYLLHQLAEYGGEERLVGLYAKRLTNIHPLMIDPGESQEQVEQRFQNSLFYWVMQMFLAEFGLVKVRSLEMFGSARSGLLVEKTEFFDQLFITW